MTEYAGREKGIEARAEAATEVLVNHRRYQGSPPLIPASYEEDVRQLVSEDIPYLRTQLGEARKKLEAVKKRIKFHTICFKELPCTLPAELLLILKGGD